MADFSIIIEKLRAIVGRENVLAEQEDLISLSYDGTPLHEQLPICAVSPRNKDDIIKIVRLANRDNFSIVPRGTGTGLSGGSIPGNNSIVLQLHHWDQILEIDEKNLTATIQPGVITQNLHSAVEKRGLFYPPDPGSMKICTIGGNVAENSGGLRGLKYGVTSDYVMGIEAVLPDGDWVKLGNKCVKNVAGINMKDLFIGSEGILGIITQILLKLIPKPKDQKTMLAFFNKIEDAGETVSAIIAEKIIPCTLEFLDQTTIRCVEDFTKIGLPTACEALLLIEVDGFPDVVAHDAQRIIEICNKHNATEVKFAETDTEAERLKTARRSAFTALARLKPTTILEDATVPRDKVASMLRQIQTIAKKYELQFGTFGHAGDGNLHPTCLTDERNKDEMQRVEMAFEEIFEAALKMGGTITGEHGIGIAKKGFLAKFEPPANMKLMRQIKKTLDPNNILNPGKVFDQI
ncbi:MAG: FAD-binding protein [Calditrichaeota bacterium]|nr:MAG: FAD-binding protein [Calditrichota bacterium]